MIAARPALLLALALLAPVPAARRTEGRAPALWAGLSPGPFPVGYRWLDGDGAVHAWYPASGGGTPLRYRDYLGDGVDALVEFLSGTGTPVSTADSLLESPVYARSGAVARRGRYPLVLVAQGNGQDAADQAVLCEYLASLGFVVATTASPMRRTPMERDDQVGEFAERQARELKAAIRRVAAVLPADTTRVAIVGHSFGARAALLLAMQDPRVRALVSLDGGIGTATGLASFRSAPSFRPEASLPPLLHLYEALDPFMTPDFSLLRALRTDTLSLVPVAEMHHVHFTTWGFAVSRFPALAEATHATAETPASVRKVVESVAAFLRRYVAQR